MRDLANAKLKQIYETGLSLMWRFGIRRVTIEEICQEAKVSKMTFYKHFRNKTDLVKFILEVMNAERMALYRQVMERRIPFAEKMKEVVRLKMVQIEDLSREFYLDLHKHAEPELLEYVNSMVREGLKTVLDDYIQAQKTGEIRPDLKPEFIIYFLNHMVTMLRDDELIRLYDSPQELIMEISNFFVYGILPRSEG